MFFFTNIINLFKMLIRQKRGLLQIKKCKEIIFIIQKEAEELH